MVVTWYIDHPLCNGWWGDLFEPLPGVDVVPARAREPEWVHWSAALLNQLSPDRRGGWSSAFPTAGLNLGFLPLLDEAGLRPSAADAAWRLEVDERRGAASPASCPRGACSP